jgi:WD40 repeat protein
LILTYVVPASVSSIFSLVCSLIFGTSTVSASSDLTIRLWETEAWEASGYSGQSLYGHDHTISCARFVGNGDFVVSASRDRTMKVWEVSTKSVVSRFVSFLGSKHDCL